MNTGAGHTFQNDFFRGDLSPKGLSQIGCHRDLSINASFSSLPGKLDTVSYGVNLTVNGKKREGRKRGQLYHIKYGKRTNRKRGRGEEDNNAEER